MKNLGQEPTPTRRVLVVDDEMPIRSAALHILRRAGYQVDTAVDGLDALARLRQSPADAVLLDMKMPVLDGFGFLKVHRADPQLRQAPVVIMSADDQLERRGLEMGGAKFVRKPFGVADLIGTIRQVFV
jgi:CheY-like chemotaxis protein